MFGLKKKKQVMCIGKVAIKVEAAANMCVTKILEQIADSQASYKLQACVIVMRDIFRRYPSRYENIIDKIFSKLDVGLDDPEAKAAFIWIIGEYCERINGCEDLLETFLESFGEESASVQLALLTTTVKVFLKVPGNKPAQMMQDLLGSCTNTADNPDLRDRAYMYWRMLSTDPQTAKEVSHTYIYTYECKVIIPFPWTLLLFLLI